MSGRGTEEALQRRVAELEAGVAELRSTNAMLRQFRATLRATEMESRKQNAMLERAGREESKERLKLQERGAALQQTVKQVCETNSAIRATVSDLQEEKRALEQLLDDVLIAMGEGDVSSEFVVFARPWPSTAIFADGANGAESPVVPQEAEETTVTPSPFTSTVSSASATVLRPLTSAAGSIAAGLSATARFIATPVTALLPQGASPTITTSTPESVAADPSTAVARSNPTTDSSRLSQLYASAIVATPAPPIAAPETEPIAAGLTAIARWITTPFTASLPQGASPTVATCAELDSASAPEPSNCS